MTRTPPALILLITTVASFASAFAGSSVNVALPPLGQELHLSGVALNWVVTIFVLMSAVLGLPLGRLGDLVGREAVFFWGLVVFGVGSAATALVPDGTWLLVARAVAGIGTAMGFATVTAILVDAYPPEQRGRILGINIALIYFGLSVGPVLGGLVVEWGGWRSLFWLHAGLSALVVVMMVAALRGNRREAPHGSFDLVGTALYALGLSVALVGVSLLPQAQGLGWAAAGVLILGAFWWSEGRAKNPIIPVTLFTENRIFAFSNLASVISYSAIFAVPFYLSFYLEVMRGLSPAQAGGLLLIQPLVQAALSPVAGRWSDRINPGLLASTGLGLTALGLAVLAFLDATTPLAVVAGSGVLLGLGFALFSSPNTNAIMGSVPREALGLASATLATVRQIGQMVSLGLSLVLLSVFLGNHPVSAGLEVPFLAAQRWGFGLSALLCVIGMAASLARGPRRPLP